MARFKNDGGIETHFAKHPLGQRAISRGQFDGDDGRMYARDTAASKPHLEIPLADMRYPVTPDGRYFLVRGRLWRCTNPSLSPDERSIWVAELMRARRAVRSAQGEEQATAAARARVQAAKVALGERGPVWWEDGEPDYTRKLASNTPYAMWAQELPSA